MVDHACDFPYDESDYGLEVECVHGCGRRMKVVMVGEGDLALQQIDRTGAQPERSRIAR